ncbi:hypothetical protein LMH87_002594 [Akanthomyces muscarius]|uniref:Uncharacterized protein n=2 Tax=Akanthomyces TaxID=150366 RepID=A0A168FUV9_CORDF|nr:hypothetical protein LMH87_002594 [Akanthomyces muscarius]KAJ4148108.1 hypothetical protein LMH87_002594 [Akanthomyces muscarius]OAA75651.1 hypothetical protein LEL_07639 [Akanthomyces lecanii RCEF 1005]
MATEPKKDANSVEVDFDNVQAAVWIKWDVKGGSDRTHQANLDTDYALEGSPNIQGIEIRFGSPVNVRCYGSYPPSGTPNIELHGPTNGKHKIDARRLGAYRVVRR